MVYQVSADYADSNFTEIINKAEQEVEGIIITKGTKKFVLIEQSQIRDWQENSAEDRLSSLFKDVDEANSSRQKVRVKRRLNLEDILN